VKIDTVSQGLWEVINRPHKSLKLNAILEGLRKFTEIFDGNVVSETMLIDSINYNSEFEEIAGFLRSLAKLDKAYIAIPTRPPTEKWVKPAKEEALNAAFQTFSEKLGSGKIEFLVRYEGNTFAITGNVKEDLLNITAVHPMREEAVAELLKKANASWQIIDELLRDDELVRLEYEGSIYYRRKSFKISSS